MRPLHATTARRPPLLKTLGHVLELTRRRIGGITVQQQ
jgi:hypothetical protein